MGARHGTVDGAAYGIISRVVPNGNVDRPAGRIFSRAVDHGKIDPAGTVTVFYQFKLSNGAMEGSLFFQEDEHGVDFPAIICEGADRGETIFYIVFCGTGILFQCFRYKITQASVIAAQDQRDMFCVQPVMAAVKIAFIVQGKHQPQVQHE